MTANTPTAEYLKHYCAQKNPGFALWIDGQWGAGKTWFIKTTLQKLQHKHIYISLYGLTNTQQIDLEIYRQLHPILSSRPAKLTMLALKGLLKFAVKIDTDSDKKEDLAWSPVIPDLNEKDVDILTDRTLVFDDIERASIPTSQIFGYINHFVEHENARAVLIGNSKELIKANQDEDFQRTREKLIGHTLQIAPDTESATDSFATEIQSTAAQKIIYENLSDITSAVRLSKLDNLRNLRQAIKLFELVFEALPIDIQQHKQVPADLLRISLALSFEIRSGGLDIDSLEPLDTVRLSRSLRRAKLLPEAQESALVAFYDKYELILPSSLVLEPSTWKHIYKTGLVPREQATRDIRRSSYFPQKPEPWLLLWSYFDLTDDDFDMSSKEAEQRLRSKSITDIEEFAHTVHFFLRISEEEEHVSKLDRPQTIKLAMETIAAMPASELVRQRDAIGELARGRGIKGRGFSRKQDEQFSSVMTALRARLDSAIVANLPDEAAQLLLRIKSTPNEAFKELYLGTHSNSKYWDVPILRQIPPAEFVSATIHLPPDRRWRLNSALLERYKETQSLHQLSAESEWLAEVILALEQEQLKRKGKVSAIFLNVLRQNLALSRERLLKGTSVPNSSIEEDDEESSSEI